MDTTTDNTTDQTADKRFSQAIAIKFTASESGVFTGYGSTWDGEPDSYGDLVSRSAFSKSIAAHRAAQTSPSLLWSHDPQHVLGTITQLKEDGHGLHVTGKLELAVAKASEAHALLRANALSMSIGYNAIKTRPIGRAGRQLDEVHLREISLVAMPANTNARILSVKAKPSLSDLNNPRVLERTLRDAGWSRTQAREITFLGKAAMCKLDAAHADSILSRKLIAAAAAMSPFSR